MYKNFTNYDVCEDGRIWSKKRKKWLKPYTTRKGYQQVDLIDNEGKRHGEKLHKVVFFAVNGLWEIPQCMQINHIDEVKTNCQIANLELVSAKQNCNHGTRNKRIAKALTNHPNRSKRVAAYKNGELIIVYESTNEARRQGFNQGNVAACCRGERKTHKGYTWKYLDE